MCKHVTFVHKALSVQLNLTYCTALLSRHVSMCNLNNCKEKKHDRFMVIDQEINLNIHS